jgi:hypothetical protein
VTLPVPSSTRPAPNSLLLRLSFFRLPSDAESAPGVPGRLPLRDGPPRDGDALREPGGAPKAGGGSSGSKDAEVSTGVTGWMVGFVRETWRGAGGGEGGGYSGARCVAEERRFFTFVRRLVGCEDVVLVLAEVLSGVSVEVFEKRPDRRLLDFFLSPNMVRIAGWSAQPRKDTTVQGLAELGREGYVLEYVTFDEAARKNEQKAMHGFSGSCAIKYRRKGKRQGKLVGL